MRTKRQASDADGFARLDGAQTRVLSPEEERELLGSLSECKRRLAEARRQVRGVDVSGAADHPQAPANAVDRFEASDGPTEAALGAVYRRYRELRGRLALANLRLVAHVAKRFRDRGIAYGDLLQEGFCGLLEAIDRFDLTRETRLATYATWWVRQAIQQAVASGAYPVRLSPRHLRQLARNQDELDRAAGLDSSEIIQRIHTATRPTVSLNASIEPDSGFNLLQTMSDPEGDRTGEVDAGETVTMLLRALRPREKEVMALRFGLGGKPRLSLSQVGKALEVSKERVRQIQDRALEKLRAAAEEYRIDALTLGGA
jgi:RNA polymerase primary sigma factor